MFWIFLNVLHLNTRVSDDNFLSEKNPYIREFTCLQFASCFGIIHVLIDTS